MDATVTTIPVAASVRSLAWEGDRLVDWLGSHTYGPGDTVGRAGGGPWPVAFDDARPSATGEYVLLLARLGTTGVVLHDGRPVRQFSRASHDAEVYDYPATVFRLPDGRDVLAHCPDAYNRIELDELPTFRRLTARDPAGAADDVFHSRLAANPGGTRLLSAGWVWQPFNTVTVHDVPRALADPASLDRHTAAVNTATPDEVDGAAFQSEDRIVCVCEADAQAVTEPNAPFPPGSIGIFDVPSNRFVHVAPVAEPVGTLMPVGASHVVGFYGHPKLIDLATGRVVHRWPDLRTGTQRGSILWHHPLPPPLATDVPRRRFAVADDAAITVVQLPDALPTG